MTIERGWLIERRQGLTAHLHATAHDDRPGRRVVINEPTDRSLVWGSTQRPRDRVEETSPSSCRRRSGGGVVLVGPGAQLWIDVVIDRDDPLWDDDVGRSFEWFGDVWARALASVGVSAQVYRGANQPGPLGRQVCFAGIGPGEVLSGSRKVVGMAQRRTAGRAVIQSMALWRWDPEEVVTAAVAPEGRREATELLADAVLALAVPRASVLDALLAALSGGSGARGGGSRGVAM